MFAWRMKNAKYFITWSRNWKDHRKKCGEEHRCYLWLIPMDRTGTVCIFMFTEPSIGLAKDECSSPSHENELSLWGGRSIFGRVMPHAESYATCRENHLGFWQVEHAYERLFLRYTPREAGMYDLRWIEFDDPRQCLSDRCILPTLRCLTPYKETSTTGKNVDWKFTTKDAVINWNHYILILKIDRALGIQLGAFLLSELIAYVVFALVDVSLQFDCRD